ncbi:MAG: septum formation protein Maf [Bacteroidaceae bacterium]|nr:septum formation protein Maf [Bacteroidaceae bacterium]
MLDNIKNYKVVLASASPRRRELMGGLDIPFVVQTLPDVDETFPKNLSGGEIPLYISKKKADAYRPMMKEDELIITADTIVWLDGKALGKPSDEEDARRMLRNMSGKRHSVFTGVTITTVKEQCSFVAQSNVSFALLNEEEIDYYIKKYKPMDKAGAYGAQEWIGYIGMENIEGSYFNVMGLPVQRLYNELKKITPMNAK